MGFSVSRQPSYMYQSPSGYIFRLRIPNDLRRLVGKCEFRYSLRAGALRVAKHRARCIASYIQQLFIKIRKKNMTEFTPEHITHLVKESVRKALGDDQAYSKMTAKATPGTIIVNGETALESSSALRSNNQASVMPSEHIPQMVQQYIRETLDNDEKCRAIGGTISTDTVTLDGMSLLEASNMKADEAQALLKSVTRWIQQADHSVMHPVTEKILNAAGVLIDPASDTYKTLSRELLKAFQGVLNVRILRSAGDYSISNKRAIAYP